MLPGDRPVQIETNGSHFCARLESGRVACWGYNGRSELGDGTTLPADGLVMVEGVEDAELLFDSGLCVRTKSGDTLCWGDRECSGCANVPGTHLWRVPNAISGSREIGGPGNPCFVTTEGGVECFGQISGPLAGLASARAVHQGHYSVCGEDAGGQLGCRWRYADHGDEPWQPPLPTSNRVAVGAFHICVLSPDDRVHCWGDRPRSGYAEPEPDWPKDEYGPVLVLDDLRASSIAAGDDHTCVTTEDSEVRCWGRTFGQGNVEFEGVVNQLAVGHSEACALLESGAVDCWALTSEAPHRLAPTRVPGLPMLAELAGPPPRTTASELREALAWADSPRRIAKLAAMERGLVFGVVEGGKWRARKTACFTEHVEASDFGERFEGSWSCDEGLTRCVAQRRSEATVFRWTESQAGGRSLVAVVDYSGAAPATEPAEMVQHMTDDLAGCGLWRAVWRRDEALVGDQITILNHPANDLGDYGPGEQRPPTFSHHCGEEARRIARAHLGVSPTAEDWRCDAGVNCTHNLSHGARGALAFRPDPSRQPKLLVVGEDVDSGFGRPLLAKAVALAKQQRCP